MAETLAERLTDTLAGTLNSVRVVAGQEALVKVFSISILFIFILLLMTVGPITPIVPFVQLTAGAEVDFCRTVAFRAFLASTVVVVSIAALGPLILANRGVSFDGTKLPGSTRLSGLKG